MRLVFFVFIMVNNKNLCLPVCLNLQHLDYRLTALTLELKRMSSRMLDFGYLNSATCERQNITIKVSSTSY